MVIHTLLLTVALAQTSSAPGTPTDCAIAMARSTSSATAQLCSAEAELRLAQTEVKDSPAWKRHGETAAGLYKKAFTLPADEVVKVTIVERLIRLYDTPMLNDETEMLAAFRELITLQPNEAKPLLRMAAYQESRGAV